MLPKLLYISDVPVESTFAGPTLIYRLFQFYPQDRILIIQGSSLNKTRRLPKFRYLDVSVPFWQRLRNSRFRRIFETFYINAKLRFQKKVLLAINDFEPEIIVTVSFGLLWAKAHEISLARKIPLHLIIHDDWLSTEYYGSAHANLENLFVRVFKDAERCFVISDSMNEYYNSLFGRRSITLWPYRSALDIVAQPRKICRTKNPLKFCYAGSLYVGDYFTMLNTLVGLLENLDCELHIYSNVKVKDVLHFKNLSQSTRVFFHDMVSPEDLRLILDSEMDVALVLNSLEDTVPFRYNFPSKLVDYSSSAIPVLLWGAKDSCVINWAEQNDYPVYVIGMDIERLNTVLLSFLDEEIRFRYSREIVQLGMKYFSYESGFNRFIESIR